MRASTDARLGFHAARHLSDAIRQLVDAAESAVLRETDPAAGFPEPLRREIAQIVAEEAGADEVARKLGKVAVLDSTEVPGWFDAAVDAAVHVSAAPESVGRSAVDSMARAGADERQVVIACQIIGYTSFLVRLDAAAVALDALPDASEAPPDGAVRQDTASAASAELPHPRKAFPLRGWIGWLSLAGDPADFPPKDEQKPNDYYRVLMHDPVSLEHRTVLYDQLLRGAGDSTSGDREMAALAVSLTTPCMFCSSVHGRRHFSETKDSTSSVELLAGGPEAVSRDIERAIAQLGAALGRPQPEPPVRPIGMLRSAGYTTRAVAEISAVAAMFGWANRLMTTLGEPVD